MSDPFVGEIRIFAGNFAPAGWAICDGSILSIAENEALFSLIGTTYGGDGQSIFALPNLQARVPIHQGSGFLLGQAGGAEQVKLTVNQMPAHTHVPQANAGTATQTSPAGNVWANSPDLPYSNNAPTTALDPAAIGRNGGSQSHDNMLPFLAINFIISLYGIYPEQ